MSRVHGLESRFTGVPVQCPGVRLYGGLKVEGAVATDLGAVDPSFRALSGRPKFTVRRHKSNQDSPLP